MSIRTWVGRFSIVEGQVREEGPWLGVFLRQLPEDDSRDLYVLAEPALPGSEEFCGQLVEVVGRLFQKESLSLTGALVRSLRAAHENLRDWNRKSLREHQVAAGATCLLLRGQTAHLAQVGPSLAYFYRDGRLTSITPQDEAARAPLGLAEEFRPQITRYDLEPGDLLLVASSRLAAIADEAAVAGVLARSLDDALPELFLLTRDLLNFSALLATCFVEADKPLPEEVAVPEELAAHPAQEQATPAGQTVGKAAGADEEPPAPPDSAGGGFAWTRPETRTGVTRLARPTAGSLGAFGGGRTGVAEARTRPDGQPSGRRPNGQDSGSPVAVMAPPTGFGQRGRVASQSPQPAPSRVAPLSVWEETSREGGNGYELLVPRVDSPPPGMERPVVRLRAAAATPRYRYTRTTSTLPRIFPVPRLAVLAAVTILVVGLVAWFAMPRSVQENQEQRFTSLLADARTSLQAASQGQVTDAAQRRALLSSSLARLDEAAAIYPDDGQMRALRIQAQAALADLDAIVDLGEMRLVADLDLEVAGELSLQQMVVGGGAAFLLDEAGSRVVELPLSPGASAPAAQEEGAGPTPAGARVVLQAGELAGAVKASRPLYIFWWQAEGESGRLLVLDDQRHLFSVTPGGEAAPLVLRGAQEWGSLDGAATFGGNLYILDVASNQVWRYPPTDSGFDSERSGLLGEVDLSGATALTVDSDLYLLTEKGGIRRFTHGVEEPFALAGIDRALLSPTSLTVNGQSGLLVVDRGNKRLVSLSTGGEFQAQFVSRTFTDLRAATVDAEAGLLYVLVGDSLYVTEMPRP
jgi:hypothetical protein